MLQNFPHLRDVSIIIRAPFTTSMVNQSPSHLEKNVAPQQSFLNPESPDTPGRPPGIMLLQTNYHRKCLHETMRKLEQTQR